MDDLEVKASPDVEKQVSNWVCEQIDTALQDRSSLEKRWTKWIKQYEEILPVEKTFPWKNCSNISLPVTPIAVETIHAREVNTLFSIRPYINIKPKKKASSRENCSSLELFLNQIFQHVVKLYQVGSAWMLEKNKMGTSYLKVYWNYDKKKVRKGKAWVYEIFDDVKVEVVSIEDLIYPTNAKDIQTCLFLSHKIRTDWNNLSRRGKMKIYKNVDKIETHFRTDTIERESGNDIQRTKEDIERLVRTSPDILKEYEIHEVYFDYDVDNDGFAEQTVMTIEKESRIVLRWIYHPYDHGKRPFVVNKYMERTGRIAGKGLCEMSEYTQEITNTIANQTLDNMTLANAKVFKARKGVKDDLPKDGIYPGCTVYLDDPNTDLMEFTMGDVKQSNFAFLNMVGVYQERRTKVTDYTLGRESSSMKSRATATGTLALLQESGRHFDLVINNSREALVELAYQVLELYIQYRPDKVLEVTGEGEEIMSYKMPENLTNLREDYEFYCAATSLSVNKEIEKQTNLLMIQQLGQVFQQMIQLLMMINNPQVQLPPDIMKFVTGVLGSYYRMAEDLVRSFEKIDIKSYMPELPEIVKEAYGQGMDLQGMLKQMGGMINDQSGNGTDMAGVDAAAGMGGVPEIMSRPPEGGDGVLNRSM